MPAWGKPSVAAAGLALLTIADASSFISANNPSIFFTTRAFSTQGGNKLDNAKEDIRLGVGKAIIETTIVGYGAVLITGSWWPLVIPLAYCAIDWAAYEWALAHPHAGTDIASQ